MRDYQPNERIVKRACELWIEMLTDPKYDNLGPNSPESPKFILINKMASGFARARPKNNTPEILERFGEELRKILMEPLEWQSDLRGEPTKYTTFFRDLGVDYHPDVPLGEAAKRAGLKMEFPWKTHIWLNEDSLSLRYGYGAQPVFHYPLKGDRWLVTSLNGSDIAKIIALVESGVISGELTVENPSRHA